MTRDSEVVAEPLTGRAGGAERFSREEASAGDEGISPFGPRSWMVRGTQSRRPCLRGRVSRVDAHGPAAAPMTSVHAERERTPERARPSAVGAPDLSDPSGANAIDTPLRPGTNRGPPGSDPAPDLSTARRRLLVLTSIGHFVNDGTVFFVPVVATLLASGRAASPFEITAMLVVYYAASSLLGIYVGHWADRSGRPLELMALGLAILGAGMGGFYVALVLVSGSAGFAAAIIAAFVVGFGSSFYHPLGASLLQAGFDRRQLGTALGINGAIGSVGRALYPSLFFLIGLIITDNSAVLAFAAIGIAASAVVASSGPGRRPANLPAAGTRSVPAARQAFTLGIVTLTAVAFVRSAATFGVVAFLPTYLQLVRPLWPGAPLGIEVTILYLGGILGQPFFGALASRIDIRLLLSVTSLGSALSTLGFLLVGGAPAVAFLFLTGFFTFSAFPLLMSLSAEYVDPRSASLANSLVFGLGSGGGMAIGPLIVGLIIANEYAHLSIGFAAMIVLGVAAAVAVLMIPRSGTQRSRMPLFG